MYLSLFMFSSKFVRQSTFHARWHFTAIVPKSHLLRYHACAWLVSSLKWILPFSQVLSLCARFQEKILFRAVSILVDVLFCFVLPLLSCLIESYLLFISTISYHWLMSSSNPFRIVVWEYFFQDKLIHGKDRKKMLFLRSEFFFGSSHISSEYCIILVMRAWLAQWMNGWIYLIFFILRSLSELLIRYNQVNVEIEFLITYSFLFHLKNWFYLIFFFLSQLCYVY